MNSRLMLLPAPAIEQVRLLEIPGDYEEHEAFRHVVGIIAAVEEQGGTNEDIIEALEERGFKSLDFIVGPDLP